MAWRKPTADDLSSHISEAEIETFGSRMDTADAVEDLLATTVSFVRGFCASNRACVLDPDEGTLPPMLIAPAMDYAAFDLLKRIDIEPNEARAKARSDALALFEKVAEGKITPEPGAETTPDRPGVPVPSVSVKPAIL